MTQNRHTAYCGTLRFGSTSQSRISGVSPQTGRSPANFRHSADRSETPVDCSRSRHADKKPPPKDHFSSEALALHKLDGDQ